MNNLQEIICTFNVRIFNEEKDNEDEYSASACEIMQRRSSSRWQSRRKRRPSSPFGIEAEGTLHRRSSAYTISSGELVLQYLLFQFILIIDVTNILEQFKEVF